MRVSTVPISRNRSEVSRLALLNELKKPVIISLVSGFSTSENPVSLSVPSPKKRNAMPKSRSPTMRRFFMYIRSMPRKNAG